MIFTEHLQKFLPLLYACVLEMVYPSLLTIYQSLVRVSEIPAKDKAHVYPHLLILGVLPPHLHEILLK